MDRWIYYVFMVTDDCHNSWIEDVGGYCAYDAEGYLRYVYGDRYRIKLIDAY